MGTGYSNPKPGADHRPLPSDPCEDTLASCTLIIKRMQVVLERDGLRMLHRSKWRCLADSYSVEIKLLRLFLSNLKPCEKETMLHELAGCLQALELAVQEGEACIQDYVILEGKQCRSWLVEKAVKLTMSTDVVDVHLHHFLWVSSAVYYPLARFADRESMTTHVLLRTHELCQIWEKVDEEEDMRIARDRLSKLKGRRVKGTKTCQLIDFIIHKLDHIEEAPHNHVTPDSLPPNYMCIDSDQCLRANMQCLFYKSHTIEIRQVMWLGGCFALKSFPHMYYSNPIDVERQKFNREAAIQASVCHSHVLPLVCCTSKPPGLLMELMQEDLYALITNRKTLGKNPPFPLLMAVDLMLQIAKGMEYLHGDTLRIVHRDLKSHNILVSLPVKSRIGNSNHARSVSRQVHLKIADFGVSKGKHKCSEYTTRDQGTTCWMAPEVYEMEDAGGGGESNEPTKYSNKADVYSFGMVCFEILTGNPPFEGGGVRSRVVKGERPKLPPHCPSALSSLIHMCWDAEPSRRPNFTRICSILRYFKACIFLQDCHVDEAYHDDRLSRPLTSPIIAVNDNLYHHLGDNIEPRPLRIPLEMYVFGAEVHHPVYIRSFSRELTQPSPMSLLINSAKTSVSSSYPTLPPMIGLARCREWPCGRIILPVGATCAGAVAGRMHGSPPGGFWNFSYKWI